MNNILLNSLNKKILVITIALLFLGFITQTFRPSSDFSHQKVYMHNGEQLGETTNNFVDVDVEVQFLALEEVERILQNKKYEELYIKTDSKFDQKVENIERYMFARNAPLGHEAEFMVIMANKFNLDYRLLPAISIIESSGGLHLYRKYNAWGWGGAEGFTFENWEHSIYVVSRGMAGYYAMGLDTPIKMAPRYNPHTPEEWGPKVEMVMNRIGPKL